LLANGDELNLILPKSARPLYFSFLMRLFGTPINIYCEKKIADIFAIKCATFSPQNITGLDASLDGTIWTAFNIDFNQSNS